MDYESKHSGSRNPSILICSDYLPPSGGGVEVVVDELALSLDNTFDISMFTLENPGLADQYAGKEIDVYTASTLDLTEKIGLQSQFSISAFSKFRNVMKEVDPDIIHVHNRFFLTSAVPAFWKFLLRFETPVVTTLHLGKVDQLGGIGGKLAQIYENTVGRCLLHSSDEVVGVSEAVADHAESLYPQNGEIHVVPNGVDSDKYRPNTETTGKTILFVGRLVRNKGPHVFVEALPDVLDVHPDAQAVIVGTGPMRDELERKARKLGIRDSILFEGRVESVAEELRNAAVFCRPSFSEGMPLTLLEAMSSGVPPVVTPVAGVNEVVEPGETGLLVEEDSSAQTAEGLITLLDDPELRSDIGCKARRYVVENHSWEKRAELIKNIYISLLE